MLITKKRLKEIKAFQTTDFSDCPELTDEQLVQLKPIKKTIRINIDVDIFEWLKSAGRGYQARMNAILREAMLGSV
jgi:uncharacterized protein (DUF4415 family)